MLHVYNKNNTTQVNTVCNIVYEKRGKKEIGVWAIRAFVLLVVYFFLRGN